MDNINPDHYKFGGIETIDFIEAKELNYNLGSAIKYISRAGKKDPSTYIEDLKKAAFYINREIEKGTPKKPSKLASYQMP